ncbi:rRNA-binding ribosome biosynthesis protein utp25 [Marasmius crinis-equi]|uniref:U3 small nucleolar RNA-associated protein 25 n=1 Tax=Marasmius crinis-equi TaxID=585013 RepID=A0ABR3G295_9AGAR
MDDNSTTTKLLTLLNVSATKSGKHKWDAHDEHRRPEKLNKRRTVKIAAVEDEQSGVQDVEVERVEEAAEVQEKAESDSENEGTEDSSDPYEKHFGCTPLCLSGLSRTSIDAKSVKVSKVSRGKLGQTSESLPEGSEPSSSRRSASAILERVKGPFSARQVKLPKDQSELQNDVLSVLSDYQDFYSTFGPWETKKRVREAISLHVVNHITKKRRKVLKNNERLSNASKSKADPPEDVQDQGFTRASVLILLPTRNSALAWFNALISHTPSTDFQIENHSRFTSEYGLPPDAVDKLASAEPGTYPLDHVETFKGNVDDCFRVGIKMTRKSVKAFSDFYQCDLIIASPLGLRQSIQKEKGADYLSSVEILVMDQLDALTMQNWDHVKASLRRLFSIAVSLTRFTQFVLEHLNKLPKDSHDTDFSRVKPWYLDGHAEYLRQSILLSAYETPETRALFNTNLKNVAGRIRQEKLWPPVDVPEGLHQDFVRFDCVSPQDEADKRFNYFTTQLLPAILKSAVQSANTAIFIPSYFDFIRVQNHFRTLTGAPYAVLSEYSTNQDISRARQAFFSGQKSFLLITERFHFYKRYKLRGTRNIIFYGPPDHPQFYSELLSYPFLDDGVESSDVTCRVLYSKYDWFRLERIAGTEAAAELIKSV